METIKQEAEVLINDARIIAINISDKDFSRAKVKHSVAIICQRYAELYVELNKEN